MSKKFASTNPDVKIIIKTKTGYKKILENTQIFQKILRLLVIMLVINY